MLMAEPSTYDMFALLKKNNYVDGEPSTYAMFALLKKNGYVDGSAVNI